MSNIPVIIQLKNIDTVVLVWYPVSGNVSFVSSGTVFPENTTIKDSFYNTSNNTLYDRNSSNTEWIAVLTTTQISVSNNPTDIPWALLTDGTRKMTGSLDMDQHNIDNALLINNVDVVRHATSTNNPHNTNALQIGLGNVTNDEQLKKEAKDFTTFKVKEKPIEKDIILIEDAEDKWNKKQVNIGTLHAGLTEESHKTLNQLIHFLSDGPGDGFSIAPYREVLPTASPFPTNIVWWDSVSKIRKIVEQVITRNANKTASKIVWKLYDSFGNIVRQATDTITYSGITEISRIRTFT